MIVYQALSSKGMQNNFIPRTGLHWPAFLKLFQIQIPRRRAHHSGTFFPGDHYEYLNHFFPARRDLSKLYVKTLEITLKSCF